jgi:TonB family protein
MGRDWKQWEGQVVNGSFPLRQYLGGSDHSAVFLTERRGREPQRAAIKLIAMEPANAAVQLARWDLAAKVSHPHLLRLFETGSWQLDKMFLLYVVMEYAEENLAQILPQRPLTPAEARDLLEPALDALAYIHGKSLAHGRLKPSNIMAAQDQLKLSSDSLIRVDVQLDGDQAGNVARSGLSRPSVYDAPEVASGKISAASDSWSLGVTLMEALTQRLPALEGMAEPVPETVPAPFMGIAHCCLRRDPRRRCSAADIAARLRSTSSSSSRSIPIPIPISNSASSISHSASKAQGPSTVRIPAAAAKWRYILPVVVLALVATAVLIGPRLFNQRAEDQSAEVSSENSAGSSSAPSTERASENSTEQQEQQRQQNRAAKSAAAPAIAAKPSARKPGTTNQNPTAAARPPKPIPSEPAPPVADAPVASSSQGSVVQQIMPSVSKSARDTIHGTIKVRVKVTADSSGNVATASFVSPGPSQYFARQAMQAAQQWKFVPVQGQDPRTWIVRFGFKRSGTDAVLEPAKP